MRRIGKVTAVIGIALVSVAVTPLEGTSTDWRRQQVRWWSEEQLIKDAVVSTVRLLAQDKSRQADQMFVDHHWRVVSLLLLYDGRQTKEARLALIALSSYYLGEAGAEIHRCLIVRKGASIRSELVDATRDVPRECVRELGDARACPSRESVKARLEGILRDIDRDVPCTIEQ